MAKANKKNIQALRNAAQKLSSKQKYEWGHMGRCNCGYLVREVTNLSDAEIHQLSMEKSGDWREQLREYCPDSGIAMDVIIDIMLDEGFSISDLIQLERLENLKIISKLPQDRRNLRNNVAADVALYLETWADILQNELDLNEKYETPSFHRIEVIK